MLKEIKKSDIPNLIKDFIRPYSLYAPVKKGREFVFARIREPEKVVLGYKTTTLPPTKFFFPLRETLFKYKNGQIKKPDLRERTLLFGVHLVDIHGIIQLDEIMAKPKPDYYYLKRRENTTIVGVTGNDRIDEFQRVLGVDTHTGYDVFLEDAGKSFLAKSITKKGDRILRKKWFKTTDLKEPKIREEYQSAYDKLHELKAAVELTKDSPVWKKYADQCYGCGNCSFVCPLCFCYDIEDKPALKKGEGHRERHFDACFYESFTRVHARGAEGHVFESEHKDRFYHWYHHKFVQMMLEFGKPGCVNCGRCIKYCPAGINFKEVLQEAKIELHKKLSHH